MKQSVLLTVLIGLAFSLPLRAQTPTSSDGTDFYIGYFAGLRTSPAVYALIGSYGTDTIRISTFDATGKEVLQMQFVMYPLTTKMQQLDPAVFFGTVPVPFAADNGVGHGCYHITSTSPISLQVYSEGPGTGNSSELYLALPTDILGTSYTAACYANVRPIENDPERYPVIEIIGIQDSTFVDIVPSCPTRAAIPRPLRLNRGETYTIHSAEPYGQDLSGTTIDATLPVVVLSGHEGASLPDLNGKGKYEGKLDNVQNPLIEQLRPTVYWQANGNLAAPLPDPKPGVPVHIDLPGSPYLVTSLGADTVNLVSSSRIDALRMPSAGYLRLDSVLGPVNFDDNKGVGLDCHQLDYYRGKFLSGVTFALTAPMMMNIIPVAAWKSEYLVHVPAGMYKAGQYLSIIYSTTAPPVITHIGQKIPYALGTSNVYRQYPKLSYAIIPVTPGTYHATSSEPFIVYSHGRSENDYKKTAAYGAPCGMLGIDWSAMRSSIELDSSCTGWTANITYRGPAFENVLGFSIFDAKQAVKLRAKISINARMTYAQRDDTTWSCSIEPIDPLKDMSASLYLQTTLGLRFLRTVSMSALRYSVPKLVPLYRVLVGSDTCARVAFVNRSKDSIIVDSASLSDTSTMFSVSGAQPTFPAALAPNDTLWATVCAHPEIVDSTFRDTLLFHTACLSIPVPLVLSAIEPRVNWLSADQQDSLVCGTRDTVRVWLINDNLTAGTEIMKDVHITGPDASEFHIVRNQLGYDPLSDFPMDPGQKIWIDVEFRPDMTKPEPARWADRHATIIAANYLRNDPRIALTATITRPSLDVDLTTVDLGETTVGVSRTASVTVRNTGNAPLSISDIQLGDSRLSFTGLAVGDIIAPGAERILTVTLSSDTPDSIVATLLVRCNEDCADPREVEVMLVVAADPEKRTSIAVEPAAFEPQFTCQSRTSTAHFQNTGQADVQLIAADIVSDVNAVFTFADGARHRTIQKVLTTGQDETIEIHALPRLSGASTATLLFTWDSLGTTRTTQCPISVTAATATTAIQLAATATGLEPGKTFTVPVTITSAPPTLATRAVIAIAYRGDLFSYRSMSSAIGAQIVGNTYQPDGSQRITIVADDPAGISSGEVVCSLTFESMLTLEDSTPIRLTDARFLSGDDSLCVDWTEMPTEFYRAEQCGDSLIKQVLEGKTELHVESIAPNPSMGPVTVVVSSATSENAELRVIDPVGRVALQTSLCFERGRNTVRIDVSGLPSGSYFVQIESGGARCNALILHER